MTRSKEIGTNIRKLRIQNGIVLSKFAEILGVSVATASLWESGERSISDKTLKNICNVLNCSRTDIFGFYITAENKQLDQLEAIFSNLSEDSKHLLLVRAMELSLIDKEKSTAILNDSAA